MKCADILKILHSDKGDLEAVARHIKNCPDCASKFALDLKLEMALQQLSLDIKPVDITSEVSSALYLRQKRLAKRNLVKRWAWILTGLAIAAFWLITIPFLTGLLQETYGYLYSASQALDKNVGTFVENLISSESFSENFSSFLYLLGIVMTAIVVFLWQEFRSIAH